MLGALAKNRTTEKDIRAWLTANGFEGKKAEITGVELYAVGRPGWLQIFSFNVCVRNGDQRHEHFGVVRDDERLRGKDKTQIELFEDAAGQQAKLAELSQELIVRGGQSGGALAFVFLFGILLLACAVAVLKFFSDS